MRNETLTRRLHEIAKKRLEPGEEILGTCRVWYSRPAVHHWAAARFRDYVVLTDRRLLMYSAGWLTRQPRRRVLADRLDDLILNEGHSAPGLVISHPSHAAMLLQFGRDETSQMISTTIANCRAKQHSMDQTAASEMRESTIAAPVEVASASEIP